MTGFAIGEIVRGVALPVLALAAHLTDFRAAVTLMDRAERRARFYRLQLLRIANKHHLGFGLCRMGQYPFQLARTDHARLVDDKNIARCEQVAALSPAMLQAGNGARRYVRSAFEIFRRDARERHASDLVAGRFQASRAMPSIALFPVPAWPTTTLKSRPSVTCASASTCSPERTRPRRSASASAASRSLSRTSWRSSS